MRAAVRGARLREIVPRLREICVRSCAPTYERVMPPKGAQPQFTMSGLEADDDEAAAEAEPKRFTYQREKVATIATRAGMPKLASRINLVGGTSDKSVQKSSKPPGVTYGCFISYYRADCGSEARLLHMTLERKLGRPVFIDASDAEDLDTILSRGICRSHDRGATTIARGRAESGLLLGPDAPRSFFRRRPVSFAVKFDPNPGMFCNREKTIWRWVRASRSHSASALWRPRTGWLPV